MWVIVLLVLMAVWLGYRKKVKKNLPGPVVYLEGNIGVGKSTVIRRLKAQGIGKVSEEPLEVWVNLEGFNMLEMVSSHPSKWGFTFQVMALVTAWAVKRKMGSGLVILERSCHSVLQLFGKTLYQRGMIEIQKWIVLNLVARVLLEVDSHKEHFIYLRATAQTSWQRIKKRARLEESDLTFNYIQRLHDRMEHWMLHEEQRDRVTVVDAEGDPEQVYKAVLSILQKHGFTS